MRRELLDAGTSLVLGDELLRLLGRQPRDGPAHPTLDNHTAAGLAAAGVVHLHVHQRLQPKLNGP